VLTARRITDATHGAIDRAQAQEQKSPLLEQALGRLGYPVGSHLLSRYHLAPEGRLVQVLALGS